MVLTKASAIPFDWGLSIGLFAAPTDFAGKGAGLMRGIGRAVVGQPLNRYWQSVHQPEAALDALDQEIVDVAAVDAAGRRHLRDRLAVAAVEGKGDAHPLAIIATDLEPVRTPAAIGAINGNTPVMAAFLTFAGVPFEQQAVHLHYSVDPLHVDRGAALLATLSPDQSVDAAGSRKSAGRRWWP